METTQLLISRLMGQETVVYLGNGIGSMAKMNKLLVFTTTWKNLGNIVWTYWSRTQKSINGMIAFVLTLRIGKTYLSYNVRYQNSGCLLLGEVRWLERKLRELSRLIFYISIFHSISWSGWLRDRVCFSNFMELHTFNWCTLLYKIISQ